MFSGNRPCAFPAVLDLFRHHTPENDNPLSTGHTSSLSKIEPAVPYRDGGLSRVHPASAYETGPRASMR
jgi:hypothetical protein